MNVDFKFLLSHPAHFFALGFGSGLAPKAPGTFGTLFALGLWLFICHLSLSLQIVIIFFSFLAGIYFCKKTSEDLGVHDHGAIVWDEFVGFWLTMTFLPVGFFWLLLGFVVFRIMDVLKPWPISLLDKKVKGGFGIMIDDILAGFLAGIILFLINLYLI